MAHTHRRERNHNERDDVWDRQRPFFAERSPDGWSLGKKSWVKQKSMRKEMHRWMKREKETV